MVCHPAWVDTIAIDRLSIRCLLNIIQCRFSSCSYACTDRVHHVLYDQRYTIIGRNRFQVHVIIGHKEYTLDVNLQTWYMSLLFLIT